MTQEEANLVRTWKAGMDAHNLLVREERRQASYRQRFQALSAIWQRAHRMGMFVEKPYDNSVSETWQKLRQAYFDKHGRSAS